MLQHGVNKWKNVHLHLAIRQARFSFGAGGLVLACGSGGFQLVTVKCLVPLTR